MNWWRRLWTVLFALTAAVLLSVDSRLMVDAAYLTLVPLAGAFILLFRGRGDLVGSMWEKENSFHLFLSVCCTVLLC